MQTTTVYDCKGSNLGKFDVPKGVSLAGYATGTDGVPWSAAQFNAHPDAIRIDQWPSPTPAGETADVLDVEPGAVGVASTPGRIKAMRTSWSAHTRPGQRWPAAYVEHSELTPVANALIAAGLTTNVPLFLTEPMTQAEALDMLDKTGGPFPFIGIQYEFHNDYDVSLVSTEWLGKVSAHPAAPAPKSGTQGGWRICIKCKSLFYGPEESSSRCPVGATHDRGDSYDYGLEYTQ